MVFRSFSTEIATFNDSNRFTLPISSYTLLQRMNPRATNFNEPISVFCNSMRINHVDCIDTFPRLTPFVKHDSSMNSLIPWLPWTYHPQRYLFTDKPWAKTTGTISCGRCGRRLVALGGLWARVSCLDRTHSHTTPIHNNAKPSVPWSPPPPALPTEPPFQVYNHQV